MIKHKFIVALFTLCYLLTACVAEDLQGPVAGSGEGYLVLQVGSVSAEVQSAPLTKATTTLTDLPETSKLMVNIKNEKGTVYGFPKQYAELGAYTTLPVGSYTIEAYYGSNSAIQSTPYFYDSKSIDITATSTTEVSLKPSLANAMLVPVVDEELQKHYTDWKLEVKVGSNPSQVLASKNNTHKLFVAERSTVQVIFSGQNLIGENTSKESTIISNAAKQTQYTIQCNPENLPAFTLATTATAVHTTDAENKLNGTKVKVKVESLTGTPTELISGWKAELYNTNNTLVRTFIGANVPEKNTESEMTADIGWPYLPQGNYTLKSQLTLKTGETVEAPETTVTVPEPTFTVAASAYTSYNKYLNGDIDGANACDGSTIYDMKAVPTISDALLNNSNYIKSSTLTLDGSSVTSGNLASQSWAAHTLVASYTFDGVTDSRSETYHVTGLPYTADFHASRNNKDWLGWKVNGKVDWIFTSAIYKLRFMGGFIVSPKIHIVDRVGVYVYMEGQRYASSSKSGSFIVGPTSSVNDLSTDGTSTSIGADLNTIYSKHTCSLNSYLDIGKEYLSLKAADDNTYIYLFRATYR